MKTTQQVAAELGIKHWHIRHAIDGNYIDKPPVFAGRFIFDDAHIATLKTFFSQPLRQQPNRQAPQRKEHDATALEDLFDR